MGRWSTGQWGSAGKLLVGVALLTMAPMLTETASAARTKQPHATHGHASAERVASNRFQGARFVSVRFSDAYVGGHNHSKYTLKGGKARYAYRGGGARLQCVTFARAASGIELKGNAANWWEAAAGIYERGTRPEPGSVLNFRANGRMRLGHVAVVTAVNGSREIEIEHANWAGPGANKGGVARGIPVIDVSENNDWSAVRVGLGRGGDYGSVYPTYGFIYDRADRGTMVANGPSGGSQGPAIMSVDELAEAPSGGRKVGMLPIDLNPAPAPR